MNSLDVPCQVPFTCIVPGADWLAEIADMLDVCATSVVLGSNQQNAKKKTHPASDPTLACADPMRRDCWLCVLELDWSALPCITGAW